MRHEQVTYITDVITEVISVPVTELPFLITDGKTMPVITIQDADGKNPRRVAYDPSVEEHMVWPVSILKGELEAAVAEREDLRETSQWWRKEFRGVVHVQTTLIHGAVNATFWQRLKYAFTGRSRHLWGDLWG